MIEVGVLGPLRIRNVDPLGERDVSVPGRRERRVIAVLALHVGQAVSLASLLDHLWGDEPPRTAHKSVQTAVANLRRIGRGVGAPAWIETVGDGYSLQVPPDSVDLRVFETEVATGREQLLAEEVSEAVASLGNALARWRGDLPADLGDGWFAGIEQTRLVELRLDAQADLIDAELQSGHHLKLLPALTALCDAWPLRERLHELQMLALYRAGRQSDALAAYQRLRSVLVEHGLDPGQSAQLLEGRILDQDPTLAVDPEATRVRTRHGDIPVVSPSLVGRDDDLDGVIRAIDVGPLVTLVGPGGVGKTALAELLATRQDARDVEWCSLGAVSDANSVLPVLATALGVDRRVGLSMTDAVCERLAMHPTLLVLDNCEHLLDPVAELVHVLTRRCAPLVVLATSRERLSVPRETVWPLKGLELPSPEEGTRRSASVELFIERATQSDPHFVVDDSTLGSIRAICRGLDGLPLALELAAARVRALPPSIIAKHLDDRFELLAGARRDTDARHRSLQATVAWSYDLLGEREQLLFRRLGTFAGAFTIEAAQAVSGLEVRETSALLADLVDKSMVTVASTDGRVRYRLLETLRAFARMALDEVGEREEVDGSNLAFQRDLVTAMGLAVTGPDEAEAVFAIEVAFDNIRQAIAMALRRGQSNTLGHLVGGLFAYLHFRPRWEASVWADDALKVMERAPDSNMGLRLVVAATSAWGHWFAGDLQRADAVVDEAVAGTAETDPRLADLLATKAVVLMYRQDPAAFETASRAYTLAISSGRLWLAAYLSGQLAIMCAYSGDTAGATPYLRLQAELVAELRNDSTQAWWLYCRAEVSGEENPQETIRLARLGVDSARAARSNLLENITRITAVTVQARHGDARSTLPEFAQLVERFRRSGAWTHLMVVVWNLIEALDQLGAKESAVTLLHAAPEGAPRPYGVQLQRLQAIRARLEAAMPEDELANAASRGRAFTREQAAEYALEAMAAFLRGSVNADSQP